MYGYATRTSKNRHYKFSLFVLFISYWSSTPAAQRGDVQAVLEEIEEAESEGIESHLGQGSLERGTEELTVELVLVLIIHRFTILVPRMGRTTTASIKASIFTFAGATLYGWTTIAARWMSCWSIARTIFFRQPRSNLSTHA